MHYNAERLSRIQFRLSDTHELDTDLHTRLEIPSKYYKYISMFVFVRPQPVPLLCSKSQQAQSPPAFHYIMPGDGSLTCWARKMCIQSSTIIIDE